MEGKKNSPREKPKRGLSTCKGIEINVMMSSLNRFTVGRGIFYFLFLVGLVRHPYRS